MAGERGMSYLSSADDELSSLSLTNPMSSAAGASRGRIPGRARVALISTGPTVRPARLIWRSFGRLGREPSRRPPPDQSMKKKKKLATASLGRANFAWTPLCTV